MEFLKEHLGQELFETVSEKLKGKGVKLADLSSGLYVSEEKHLRKLREKDEELELLKKSVSEGGKVKSPIHSTRPRT